MTQIENRTLMYLKRVYDTLKENPEKEFLLKEIGDECSHITEFGVRTGHSTRAFLTTNAILRSYDLYLDKDIINLFNEATKQGKNAKYIKGDTTSIDIEETDLLFIDTWHTYNQVKAELQKHANKVRKYIIFHDTISFGLKDEPNYDGSFVPLTGQGLLPAIIEFTIQHPQWKFREFKTNNNGLTILQKSE